MRGHMRLRGDAWELRPYVGRDPVTGREKYKTLTFRGGKHAAEAELARFVTEVSGGGHGAGDTTLAELIQRWLELVRDDLSPSTVRGMSESFAAISIQPLGRFTSTNEGRSAGPLLCAPSRKRWSGWLTALSSDCSADARRYPTGTESGPSVGVDRVQSCGIGLTSESAHSAREPA